MLERYTEKARRVIFIARDQASQFGSPCIETEHLLLGLLREDKALANRFLRSSASVESIRKQIEAHTTPSEPSISCWGSCARKNVSPPTSCMSEVCGFRRSGRRSPVRARRKCLQTARRKARC
jgi:ATP-dependent Clp protease ATP-binding subunit ClpA